MQLDRTALRQLPRALQYEIDENIQRKDYSQSELAVVQRDLLEVVRRQAEPGRRTDVTGENAFSEVRDRATAIVGRPFGESHKTVEKRLAVFEAAEADPARYGHLRELMDRTDRVDPAFQQLTVLRRQQEHARRTERGGTVADLQELIERGERYGFIYADPAWEDGGGDGYRSVASHYPTMPLQDIAALPVAQLAANNCALGLWCTGYHIACGNHVPIIQAWGFEPRGFLFSWPKRNRSDTGFHTSLGWFTRHGTEVCLLATKGQPLRLTTDVPHEIIDAPLGQHSEKPEEARCRIERVFSSPYLELFARREVEGWTTWGNELPPSQVGMGRAGGGCSSLTSDTA